MNSLDASHKNAVKKESAMNCLIQRNIYIMGWLPKNGAGHGTSLKPSILLNALSHTPTYYVNNTSFDFHIWYENIKIKLVILMSVLDLHYI